MVSGRLSCEYMGLDAGFMAPQAVSKVAVASARAQGAKRVCRGWVCMVVAFS